MHKQSKLYEKTLVLLKPDAIQRGLIGEITARFERKGLKIVAMKMVWPTEEQASQHYHWSKEEKEKTGNRTLSAYADKGITLDKDPIEIAESVQKKLRTFITAGPIVAMVIEGAHAIQSVRSLVGKGNPQQADVGTIRADYTIESYLLADEVDRAARNLVHASDSVEEANREMAVWFNEQELVNYNLAIEQVLYSKEWEETRGDLVSKTN